MLKKSLASLIVAALVSAIPGPAFAQAAAAARAASASRVSLTPAIGALTLPASPLARPAIATPLTGSNIQMPSVQAPAAADARYAAPVAAAVNSEAVANAVDSAAAGELSQASEGLAATYDGSVEGGIETSAVSGAVAETRSGLTAATGRASARRSVPASKNGGLLAEAGALALVAAIFGSIVSPSFRAQMVRLGATIRAWVGLGVSRTKTPTVLAEEIRQDYERKLAEQDKIIELATVREATLQLEVVSLNKRAAKLLRAAKDIIEDSVPDNDTDALVPQAERKAVLQNIEALEASLARTKTQVDAAIEKKKTLELEYKKTTAEMRTTLTTVEQDEWDAAQAKLDAAISSSTGELQKKKDEFERKANEASGQAKGEAKAAGSGVDATIRKAQAEREKREQLEELAKLKAELLGKKDDGNGGAVARRGGLLSGAAALGAVAAFLGTFPEIISGPSGDSSLVTGFYWIAAAPSFILASILGFMWGAAANESARIAGKRALKVGMAALAVGPLLGYIWLSRL